MSSHVRRLDLLLLKKIAETMGEFVREYCKVQSGIQNNKYFRVVHSNIVALCQKKNNSITRKKVHF